jgi:8-oxo-dGTP pyrophosphatase MutT (NUDIX family)
LKRDKTEDKNKMAPRAVIQENQKAKSVIANIVAAIYPFDDLEHQHIQETLSWIESGNPLFRLEKPNIPPKHLVSYFILLDEEARKVLLVDHRQAQLWLPSGGHVEVGEHPREAVVRECFEELGTEAEFWSEDPVFLTSTVTVGLTAGHTDVSLWYVLKGDHHATYSFDGQEFASLKWFHFDEIPYARSDPHMRRFIHKLGGYL